MQKEWSELNKTLQLQLKKEATYKEGINTLLLLQKTLMEELLTLKKKLKREEFDAIPFINANGYHSKTIAYSMWHIFRIEDIVAHSLIKGDEQIFFLGDYKARIQSPIITTGNELVKEQIAEFSRQLDIEELYQYMKEVKDSSDQLLLDLSYTDLKRKMTEEKKAYVSSLHVVSAEENAHWLIDYWCKKDVRGLLQMPFSRHWIMHVEAIGRIKNKILEEKNRE